MQQPVARQRNEDSKRSSVGSLSTKKERAVSSSNRFPLTDVAGTKPLGAETAGSARTPAPTMVPATKLAHPTSVASNFGVESMAGAMTAPRKGLGGRGRRHNGLHAEDCLDTTTGLAKAANILVLMQRNLRASRPGCTDLRAKRGKQSSPEKGTRGSGKQIYSCTASAQDTFRGANSFVIFRC